MTEPAPKVTIGLPIYNGEKYLRTALDSILRQGYTDFELVISDNASTDRTEDICREYVKKDRRIRYCRNGVNIGASGNFNRVVELARGEFFGWMTHDDVYLPGFLRCCVAAITQAPVTVVLVTPKVETIDEHGKLINIFLESLDTRYSRASQRVKDVLQNVSWATAQFGLFRTNALRKTNLIQPFFASDHVLLMEVALLGEIRELPETLFQRRVHPGISTTVNKNSRQFRMWFDPYQNAFKGFVPPTVRVGFGFMRAIMRSQLPLRERLLCYRAIFTVWFPKECRRLLGICRNRIAIRTRVRRFFGTLKAAS